MSSKNSEIEFGDLNSAGSWVLAPFTINPYGTGNYTWLEANATEWCSGAGTELDPYIIENITIDSGGSSDCLEIGQSDDYFIIRNCTFKNSDHYGLYMWNTNNGIVEDCTVFNNLAGVFISGTSQNNTIQYNYFYNNTGVSFRLFGSSCINNTVSNNIFVNRLTASLPTALDIQGYNNKLINNTVDNFMTGIYLNYAHDTIIKSNMFISSWRGISMGGYCFNATVFNNTIRDNHNDYGVYVNGNGSIFYRNTFINNNVNAKDSGHFNRWDNGVIGNYWDDYGGIDANDDGIGDSPYLISGDANSQDYFPIWDDGDDINPTIAINSPSGGSLYGTGAPTYSLNIFDLNLNQSWYTLNSTATRYFFTPTNGINVVPIDETGWDSFSDGSMLMTFYVNDSGGNLASDSNVIIKDATNPTISVNSPSGGSFFGTDAPTYNLNIFDLNLNMSWYTLNDTVTRYFFTPSNGINVVAIDETGWDSFSDGLMLMTFYVNDSEGNLASDSNVIIKDTTNPVIIVSLNNFTVEVGYTGQSISWTATDTNPDTYTIELQGAGIVAGPTAWTSGDAINYNILNGYGVGSYIYTVNFTDLDGNFITESVTFTVEDTTNPVIIDSPNNFTVEQGYTGQSISWTATDANSGNFTIELLGTGIVITSTSWANNTPVVYIITDGFGVGSYIFRINFTDLDGNFITESVTFTVEDTTNPVITAIPNNFTVEVGYTGQSISWTATDANPDTYTIDLQGSGIVTGPTAWTSSVAITYNIPDGFAPGVYTYTITFTDESGNSISNTVTVTINSIGETPGPAIPFGNYYILFLGIGMVSILLVERKKRKK